MSEKSPTPAAAWVEFLGLAFEIAFFTAGGFWAGKQLSEKIGLPDFVPGAFGFAGFGFVIWRLVRRSEKKS